MSRSGALFTLQQMDDHLTHLRRDADLISAGLAGDSTLHELLTSAADARKDAAAATAAATTREAAAGELSKRAKQLNKRLYDGSVGNPQELVTMQRDQETVKEKLLAAEVELLDAMEATEITDAAVAVADAAVAARQTERSASRGDDETRLAALNAEVAAAQTERDAATADVDAADLALYQHLSARTKPAVVRLNGDSCGGCKLPLGIQEARGVRADDTLVQCSNCDRILVP